MHAVCKRRGTSFLLEATKKKQKMLDEDSWLVVKMRRFAGKPKPEQSFVPANEVEFKNILWTYKWERFVRINIYKIKAFADGVEEQIAHQPKRKYKRCVRSIFSFVYWIATYFESSIGDFFYFFFFSVVFGYFVRRSDGGLTRIDSIECANCNMKC